MLDVAIMRSIQAYELIKMQGWSSFFRETVYWDRRAVIFEKDLSETKDYTERLKLLNAEMIELSRDLIKKKKYQHRLKNRQLKAVHYLEKGYGGYALVKGAEIVGEMWYSAGPGRKAHPDLAWLGLDPAGNEVYAFDWFVVSQERGNNLAGMFQNSALHSLFRKGYQKAFAYVWADNTPAFWTTRVVNKWKEVRIERMNRFLTTRMNEKTLRFH